MEPLTPGEVEQRLGELEQKVEKMGDRLRVNWRVMLALLEEQRTLARREQRDLDRAIGEIEAG